MQVVEVTQKAIDITHPREKFFSLFPSTVTCEHCGSVSILDNPNDVKYHYSNDVIVHAWLTWKCAPCGRSNMFVNDGTEDDRLLIEGYRQYFPKTAFWTENWGLVAMLSVYALILLGFAFEVFT